MCVGEERGLLEGDVKERFSKDVTLQCTFVSGCECVSVWCLCPCVCLRVYPCALTVYLILKEFEMVAFWLRSLFSIINQCSYI